MSDLKVASTHEMEQIKDNDQIAMLKEGLQSKNVMNFNVPEFKGTNLQTVPTRQNWLGSGIVPSKQKQRSASNKVVANPEDVSNSSFKNNN